jgi:hypothetical protein
MIIPVNFGNRPGPRPNDIKMEGTYYRFPSPQENFKITRIFCDYQQYTETIAAHPGKITIPSCPEVLHDLFTARANHIRIATGRAFYEVYKDYRIQFWRCEWMHDLYNITIYFDTDHPIGGHLEL